MLTLVHFPRSQGSTSRQPAVTGVINTERCRRWPDWPGLGRCVKLTALPPTKSEFVQTRGVVVVSLRRQRDACFPVLEQSSTKDDSLGIRTTAIIVQVRERV